MNQMTTTSTITAYKLNKQITSSIDLYDLLEAYYPEKHNTIVRMRNIAYRELINTGVLTADGISDSCPDLPYKNILNSRHGKDHMFHFEKLRVIKNTDRDG